MGEVVALTGHEYEYKPQGYYDEVYKNGEFIAFVSNKIPGIQGFCFGLEEFYGWQEVLMWALPADCIGYRTKKEAVRALERIILHEEEDEDNIGTTWNWEDYHTPE